jgi:hypothetical protein
MSVAKFASLLPAFLCAFAGWLHAGGQESKPKDYAIYVLSRLEPGDSAATVTKKLAPQWTATETNKFAKEPPFERWIPWKDPSLVLEWKFESASSGSQRMVVFTLFSNASKTNITDALLYNGMPGLMPLLDGPYNKELLKVKPVDNMRDVFRHLGKPECEYYESTPGKWCVKAVYYGFKQATINVQADAATGEILSVWDSAL